MFEEVILEADISAWEMQQPPVLLPSEPMKCRPSIDPASYLPAPCRCPRCSVASQVALDSTWATEQTTKLPLLLTSEIKMLGGKSTHFSYQVEGQKKWRIGGQLKSPYAHLVCLLVGCSQLVWTAYVSFPGENESLQSSWWTTSQCGQQILVMLEFIGRCPHWQNSSDGDAMAV